MSIIESTSRVFPRILTLSSPQATLRRYRRRRSAAFQPGRPNRANRSVDGHTSRGSRVLGRMRLYEPSSNHCLISTVVHVVSLAQRRSCRSADAKLQGPCQQSSVDSDHAFSPWIVAITLRVCLAALNSRYQMPCHVPVANFPLAMGTLMLAPIKALFTCAGISSGPSQLCR